MSTAELTDAERGYLEALYWLHEAELPMTAANIARAMQLSAPAVHEMIGRLERDNYITRGSDKVISFTDAGERQAGEIVGRHRLIERFLTDVLGIAWDEVHEEAERLEHAMSPVLEERMLAAIGDATTCPHGHPIRVGTRIPGVPLADVSQGASIRVLRFENEAEDLLHYLRKAGLEPGLEGTVEHWALRRSSWRPASCAPRSHAASPRPCRLPLIPRRRRGSRCPSISCSARSATAAESVRRLRPPPRVAPRPRGSPPA